MKGNLMPTRPKNIAVMLDIISTYEARLEAEHISKERMDPTRTFGSLTKRKRLAHAHYLCENLRRLIAERKNEQKLARHFAAIQMCLGFADWYTLKELTEHNRPLV